ncbi:MAG: TonB-dependent receptor [Crocinitomicaceae bacterium]
MKLILSFTILLFSFLFSAQTQNVRGKVMDSETSFPLAGAKLEIDLKDANGVNYRAVTDGEGEFKIINVPVGKYALTTKCAQYEPKTQTVEISSGKELILNITLQELVTNKEEVVVTGRKKGEIINELAVISAQQFSVEETNRYPGSRMDPARMASNFAGVNGADDSRNDIVVRGNSPLGVIYRVEGIDIPNPNHFAISGTSGGPVSLLNNKILGNSDFFMSAFPAEYGNSLSGVFDLKLRNGNNNQHEFTGQFGLLGTEFLAEGPLSKNGKSSYLVMGRYSTLTIFQKLNINLGTDAIPKYYDGAFKFNWILKNGGQLALFGMGGSSDIAIKISDFKEYTEDLYGEGDRDQYFGTSMITSGLNYKKSINEKTFISSTLAYSQEMQRTNHDYLRNRRLDTLTNEIVYDSLYAMMAYRFKVQKLSGYTAVNHKFNKQHLIKVGLSFDLISMNFLDSCLYNLDVPDNYELRWNYQGSAAIIQPFVQWKWRISDNMDVTAGIHAQYFTLTNSISPFEPRLGWKYKMDNGQAIFAGGGLHSMIQPYYTYAYKVLPGTNNPNSNLNMDFSRSAHSGIGYEKSFNKGFNIKTEAYYQYLYNIPVTVDPSSFSMINVGSGFSRLFIDELQNTGDGYNYGLELTVQKYFDKTFFFLFSGTVYNSQYRGSDMVWRNTSYNGNYVVNLLGGKEFKVGERSVIGIGGKVTAAGGKRYGFVDIAATNSAKEIIFMDSMFNERQFRDYFRADLKISWRKNADRVTHEFGLDLVNILGTKNLLTLAYKPALTPQEIANPNFEPFAEKTQLGFFPIFYYKIDFKAAKR